MKQILLFSVLMLFSIAIFAQAAPVSELRVTTTSATFNGAVPIGTKVYVVTGGTYWVATAAIASGTVVSDAVSAGSLVILNQAEQNITRDAEAANASVIKISKTKADGTPDTPSSITVKAAGINTISTAVAGEILITATEDQVLGYTQNAADNNVSITGTSGSSINILPATATVAAGGTGLAGLMTPTQVTKLQSISESVIGTYTAQTFRASANQANGSGHADMNKFQITGLKSSTPSVTEANILVSYNGLELNYADANYSVDLTSGSPTYGMVTFDPTKLVVYQNDLVTITYLK